MSGTVSIFFSLIINYIRRNFLYTNIKFMIFYLSKKKSSWIFTYKVWNQLVNSKDDLSKFVGLAKWETTKMIWIKDKFSHL